MSAWASASSDAPGEPPTLARQTPHLVTRRDYGLFCAARGFAPTSSWRAEGSRVVTEPFEPLPRGARREVEDEAARLAAFRAD